MYGLVLLLALMVMESWLRWLERPSWRRWLGFVALSSIAALTHYYLVLLWPVQALLLVLLPRATRPIRKPWLATAVGIGVIVLAFIAVSPGIRAMALDVARRFPGQLWRPQAWGFVLADFFFWGYRPELAWLVWAGLGLTVGGWIVCARRNPLTGAMLAAWGVIPLLLASLVPESLETRYLTPIFPAFLFGLAVVLARLRGRVLPLLAVVGVVAGPLSLDEPLFHQVGVHRAPRDSPMPQVSHPWTRPLLGQLQSEKLTPCSMVSSQLLTCESDRRRPAPGVRFFGFPSSAVWRLLSRKHRAPGCARRANCPKDEPPGSPEGAYHHKTAPTF